MANKKHSLVLAVALLAVTASAPGQSTITIDRVSGDGLTPGTRLRMLVSITSNTSGQTPQGVSLRVIHPDTLTFGYDPPGPTPIITVEAADLGSANAAPSEEAISPGVVGRDISTLGLNTASNPLQPQCFYVNFTVAAGVTVPYTVQLVGDPDTVNPVPYFSISPPVFGGIAPLTFVNETITGPDINPDPASVTFANTDEGSTSFDIVDIENVSTTQELNIISISIIDNGDPAGTFTIDSPPATPLEVPASSALSLTLAFSPPTDGLFDNAVLQVVSNSPGETTTTLPLAGTGLVVSRIRDWKSLND